MEYPYKHFHNIVALLTERTGVPEDEPISCDEAIKLQCFKMALTSNQLNPLDFAKEIYEWVKQKEND